MAAARAWKRAAAGRVAAGDPKEELRWLAADDATDVSGIWS